MDDEAARHGIAAVRRKSPAELSPGWPRLPSKNIAADIARGIALEMLEGTKRYGVADFAQRIDTDETALQAVLDGRAWPNVVMVVRAEEVLGRMVAPRL